MMNECKIMQEVVKKILCSNNDKNKFAWYHKGHRYFFVFDCTYIISIDEESNLLNMDVIRQHEISPLKIEEYKYSDAQITPTLREYQKNKIRMIIYDDTKEIYVDDKILAKFGNNIKLCAIGRTSPVLIYNTDDVLIGLIMPVRCEI